MSRGCGLGMSVSSAITRFRILLGRHVTSKSGAKLYQEI